MIGKEHRPQIDTDFCAEEHEEGPKNRNGVEAQRERTLILGMHCGQSTGSSAFNQDFTIQLLDKYLKVW